MTGSVTFNSYRDPNLKETLRNYEGTTEYLSGFRADQKTMTRYIIGTIASMDSPLTASDKGDLAVTYYFNKRRPEAIQSDRTAVLETTAEDIQRFAPLVKGILDQRTYCVYGNSDKISQDKGLFMSLVKIER
jgi:Zn-dependent M16 (insulinase) family peptidase